MSDKQGGFWEELGARRFAPGKGVAEPPPQGGWRRFFFVLGTHFWKLISLNLLFLAFSIPVITIPAALCGMNRVIIKLYRDGNCFVWTEFIKEFRVNIWKALPFGFIGGITLFASYYFLSISISGAGDRVELLSATIGILLLLFTVLFLNYVFLFLPTLELKSSQIARNALIFTVMEWKTNLVILASTVILSMLTVLFFPYSIPLLVFLTIALQQYFVCTAINKPLQRRIIGPAEGNKS
jgi:uncharacterized membrane protein YesL